jgi:ABC-type bacteriocin/lantibiotic exporter with double-glycine peptidase domain
VVVRDANEERVLVADPLSASVQRYTKAEFQDKWSGVIVSADKAGAE